MAGTGRGGYRTRRGPDVAGTGRGGDRTWQGPDAPVDVSGLSGKKVVYISVSNGIPVLKYWSEKVQQIVSSVAGVQLTVVDAKGSVDEGNKGFQQAIAEKADAVVLLAFSTKLYVSSFPNP